MKHWSIRTKGLVYILLIALCPLLISGLYIYESSKNEVISMTVDKIQLKHEAKDYMITTSIGSIITELEILARSYALVSESEEEKNVFLQQELRLLDEAYIGIGYTDVNKSTQYFSRYTDSQLPQLNTLSPQVEVFIEGDITDINGNVVAYVSVPVHNANKQFVGSLFGNFLFPPNYYGDEDYSLSMSDTYIYKLNGELVFHPNLIPFTVEQQGQYDEIIKQYINKNGQASIGHEVLKYNFKKYVIVHRIVNNGQWMMAEILPMSQIRVETFPTFVRIFTSIFVIITIACIFFYIYFNSITKRLFDIVKVTKQGANGIFNVQHLDASIKDEIGILSHSINGMMNRLEIMFSRLDAVINQNKSPVIVLDEQYRFSYLNKAAEKMLGVTSDIVIGKFTPISFMDFEDVEKHAKLFSEELGYPIQPGPDMYVELRKRHANYDMEFTIVSAIGERIPVYDRSSAIRDKNGKMLGIISILHDLSEQRQVEQARNRLQEIVESARDLIASVNRNSDIIYINEAGKRMLGIQDDVTNLRQCLPEDVHNMLIDYSAYARAEGYFEMETQFTNLLGESLKVSISIVSHKDAYTGELLYSCIVRDLTELLDTQEKLVEATELAEQAAAAKGNFLALMSHEIRTPLNGIIGLSQLLRKTKLDHIQLEYADKIKDSSDTLLHIVNDILDFSKLEVSKVELEQRLFNIYNVIDHVSMQISHYLGGKDNLEFKITLDDNVPKLLIGDSLRLEQILNNLCVNAVKFTHQGMIRLNINVSHLTNNYVRLQFNIADTGIGMSKSQLSKLFTPFTQADSSTTRQFGGTGLGLVIAKELVELMGGELNVQSELNKGSQFNFEVELQVPEQLESHNNSDLPKEKFFAWVIEDNREMSEYWVSLLAKQNIDAIKMTTWKDGYYRLLRLGQGVAPSFIILDMEMPDMYGIETWLSFKDEAMKLNIPIVVMTTTYGREELALLDEINQPDLIFTKPIQPYYFNKLIYEFLNGKHEILKELSENVPVSGQKLNIDRQVHILLAEDNKINQLVAEEMLKLAFVNVTIVNNGKEAIEKMSEESFDLILMDIHMPIMDGIEATKWIRERSQYDHIPIIAVTANIVNSDHEQYKQIGMQYVMTKPIELEQLNKVLNNYLGDIKINDALMAEQTSFLNEKTSKYSHLKALQVEVALERLNGKLNIYEHMLEQFSVDYREFIISLEQNIKVGNLKAVQRMLHTLKGASSYLGATQLNHVADTMEHFSLDKDVTLLLDYLPTLDERISEVIRDISTMLEKS